MRALLDNIRIRPRTCVMEITFRCNMRCLHCASDVNSNYERGQELSFTEIQTILNDLASLGCEHLTLSGGEALLRKDWNSIAREAKTQGIDVSIISNGLVIDSAMADAIREAGVSHVAISIDGIESTHDYIRNMQGSFTGVLAATNHLAEKKVPVNFVTAVTKANLDELRAIEDIVVGLNGNRWLIQLGSPLGRLSRHLDLVVTPEDLPAVADFIVEAKRRNKIRISVGDNIGYYSTHEHEIRASPERNGLDFALGCSAGCLNVGIESNGNVKGCLSLQSNEFIEGNIRDESLITIWNKPGNFSYTREFSLDKLAGACKTCDYGELCRGGCTFMAFGTTGRLYSNPYCLRTVLNQHVQAPGRNS